uniref:Uncharacterized protein n=1 Tax=Pristionchus pacificus TaxID=54126 RepID=A0A2A6BX65_PRIPA
DEHMVIFAPGMAETLGFLRNFGNCTLLKGSLVWSRSLRGLPLLPFDDFEAEYVVLTW